MYLLDRWLNEFTSAQRILDLGCGAGSLRAQLAGLRVTGVDIDPRELARNRDLPAVCAESHGLPFAAASFDLVVSNHSLEHFRDAAAALREIRRVLKPDGRLFVSVPDGASFSDRLYRLMLCGGGHFQRFSFESAVRAVEAGTGLRLAAWKELSSSFPFLDRRNFVPAPLGRLPGPFPRRVRWLGRLPRWCFSAARLALNVGARLADGALRTPLARYGWAFAFAPAPGDGPPVEEPRSRNVCMQCGAAFDRPPGARIAGLLYRCPHCAQVNVRFS